MTNSTLHFPNLYSLEKAALTLNRTQDEILRAASEGAMEVIFGLPPDFEYRIAQFSSASDEVVSIRPTRATPLFFNLGTYHCLRLMAGALAMVDSSTVGYLYNAARGFAPVHPSHHDTYVDPTTIPDDRSPGLGNQRFAFFKDDEITKCRVTKDMVFLQTEELDKFKKSLNFNLYRLTAKDLPADYQRQDILRAYESFKLDKMFVAASKFWFTALIDKNDNRTYPKVEEIVNWLVDQGFTTTQAKQAASLIRPEWAVMGAIKKPEEA